MVVHYAFNSIFKFSKDRNIIASNLKLKGLFGLSYHLVFVIQLARPKEIAYY